jgi:hypothetical protein
LQPCAGSWRYGSGTSTNTQPLLAVGRLGLGRLEQGGHKLTFVLQRLSQHVVVVGRNNKGGLAVGLIMKASRDP